MIDTHPTDDLLVAYATGELHAASSLVVAAHAEGCRACGDRIRRIETAEGELLASLPPTPLADDALDRALRAISAGRGPPARRRLGDVDLPLALTNARFASRRWIGPGNWVAHVPAARAEGWRLFVLRMRAGARLPRHVHPGDELVAVLQGAFEDGRRWSAGDFSLNPRGSAHDLHVVGGDHCAALIATRGALQWRGWARVLGPVLDI